MAKILRFSDTHLELELLWRHAVQDRNKPRLRDLSNSAKFHRETPRSNLPALRMEAMSIRLRCFDKFKTGSKDNKFSYLLLGANHDAANHRPIKTSTRVKFQSRSAKLVKHTEQESIRMNGSCDKRNMNSSKASN